MGNVNCRNSILKVNKIPMDIIFKKEGFFNKTCGATPRGKHKKIFIIIFNFSYYLLFIIYYFITNI